MFICFGRAGSSVPCGLFSSCREQGLLSSYGARGSCCSGFFCFEAQSRGAQASAAVPEGSPVTTPELQSTGSVVVTHGLSCDTCSIARGILVPLPGMEPVSPALGGGFVTTGPPGKSPGSSYIADLTCANLEWPTFQILWICETQFVLQVIFFHCCEFLELTGKRAVLRAGPHG